MKNRINIFFLSVFAAIGVVSCDDADRYSGTPVGNQSIETLHGTLTLDDATMISAVSGQKIPFSFDLHRTFNDTVTVEVTTLNKGGGRTRVYVDVMPGEQGGSDEIASAGGAIFDSTVDVYLSGIALQTVDQGKHYLLDSNVITLNTGNSSVPSDNSTKFQIRATWFNPSTTRNNFRLFIDRPNVSNYTSALGATNAGTTITVGSTTGLMPGMVVNVSSGKGAFTSNTVVTAVTGPTTFTVNQALSASNALGVNSEVSAGGNDFNFTGATSTNDPALNNATIVTLPAGQTTTGLVPGMVVWVTSGTGKFRNGTTIAQILSPTTFRLSLSINGAGGSAQLAGADVMASFPDAVPIVNGGAAHDINNFYGQVSNGTSTQQGEYVVKLSPINVVTPGVDVRFRLLWKFPDGTTQFVDGVYPAAAAYAPAVELIHVTKSGEGFNATYSVTQL